MRIDGFRIYKENDAGIYELAHTTSAKTRTYRIPRGLTEGMYAIAAYRFVEDALYPEMGAEQESAREYFTVDPFFKLRITSLVSNIESVDVTWENDNNLGVFDGYNVYIYKDDGAGAVTYTLVDRLPKTALTYTFQRGNETTSYVISPIIYNNFHWPDTDAIEVALLVINPPSGADRDYVKKISGIPSILDRRPPFDVDEEVDMDDLSNNPPIPDEDGDDIPPNPDEDEDDIPPNPDEDEDDIPPNPDEGDDTIDIFGENEPLNPPDGITADDFIISFVAPPFEYDDLESHGPTFYYAININNESKTKLNALSPTIKVVVTYHIDIAGEPVIYEATHSYDNYGIRNGLRFDIRGDAEGNWDNWNDGGGKIGVNWENKLTFKVYANNGLIYKKTISLDASDAVCLLDTINFSAELSDDCSSMTFTLSNINISPDACTREAEGPNNSSGITIEWHISDPYGWEIAGDTTSINDSTPYYDTRCEYGDTGLYRDSLIPGTYTINAKCSCFGDNNEKEYVTTFEVADPSANATLDCYIDSSVDYGYAYITLYATLTGDDITEDNTYISDWFFTLTKLGNNGWTSSERYYASYDTNISGYVDMSGIGNGDYEYTIRAITGTGSVITYSDTFSVRDACVTYDNYLGQSIEIIGATIEEQSDDYLKIHYEINDFEPELSSDELRLELYTNNGDMIDESNYSWDIDNNIIEIFAIPEDTTSVEIDICCEHGNLVCYGIDL